MTAWEKLWAAVFPSRNSRVANKTLLWEVHLLVGRAVGGRSASKGVQVVVHGSMAREDIRVAPFLQKFTFELLSRCERYSRAVTRRGVRDFPGVHASLRDPRSSSRGVKTARQSAIGEDRGRELEGKWRSRPTKEVNLWFVSNVTRSLYQPRIRLWLAPTPSPSPSLSSMDPAAVAQIAQMGLDLFVLSLS